MEYEDLMKHLKEDQKARYYATEEEKFLVDKVRFVDTNPMVNSPSHYTYGSQEAIEIIEEAIENAPSNKDGFLQAQVLKYILRMWLKDDPRQDAEKAEWYLKRLIKSLRDCD